MFLLHLLVIDKNNIIYHKFYFMSVSLLKDKLIILFSTLSSIY